MSEISKPAPVTRPGVMSLTIKEKASLYAAYMPFIQGGGLFVPTPKPYNLGDEVFLLLTLLDEPTKYTVTGKVVWITPPGAQGSRSQGIGVQFSNNEFGVAAKNKIEGILGGHLQANRSTHTM